MYVDRSVFDAIRCFDSFMERFRGYNGVLVNIEENLSAYGFPVAKRTLSERVDSRGSLINHYPSKFSPLFEVLCSQASRATAATPFRSSMDIELVRANAKPAARIVTEVDELPNILRFCHENSLKLSFSPFTFTMDDETGVGYSNMITQFGPLELNRKAGVFAYISRSLSPLMTVWIAELLGDHQAVGKMLGYPPCCIDFYRKNIRLANREYSGEFAYLTFRNSRPSAKYGEFPYFTNNVTRYFGETLLSHFPCSFNCPASVSLAMNYLAALNEIRTFDVEHIKTRMKSIVLYCKSQGIFWLRNCMSRGNAFHYSLDSVSASDRYSDLYMAIRIGDSISISEHRDRISVNNNGKETHSVDGASFIANFM
jgi:hypothetical protein